jgi:hypothetical protein
MSKSKKIFYSFTIITSGIFIPVYFVSNNHYINNASNVVIKK